MTSSPANTVAPYLQTSVWFPDDFTQFRIKFLDIYRDIANNVNVREISIYELQEFLTGEQWFVPGNAQATRQTFRKVFQIGAIAAGATLSTPHGITGVTSFTDPWGVATTVFPDQRPIPYASATLVTNQIEIRLDTATSSIVIVNGATAPNITSAIVVLEFLKN